MFAYVGGVMARNLSRGLRICAQTIRNMLKSPFDLQTPAVLSRLFCLNSLCIYFNIFRNALFLAPYQPTYHVS